jgi:hypothetical protein
MIFYAITLCFIMFICPFVGPLIWTNKILSYLILFRYFIFEIPYTSILPSYAYGQGLINPLARRPGLVISTFGLAEIISCMPDGLVKIYSSVTSV